MFAISSSTIVHGGSCLPPAAGSCDRRRTAWAMSSRTREKNAPTLPPVMSDLRHCETRYSVPTDRRNSSGSNAVAGSTSDTARTDGTSSTLNAVSTPNHLFARIFASSAWIATIAAPLPGT